MTASGPGSGSTSDLLQSLSDDLSALIRQEFQQAQQELTGKARQAGRAGAMLGGAAVLGALATGSSAALLLRILDRRLSPTSAAALTTGIYAGAAGVLATSALAELRRAWPLVPQETVAELRADVRIAADEAEVPSTER
jgi:hypothetical protein